MPNDVISAYSILDAGTGSHAATQAMLRDRRWPGAELAGSDLSRTALSLVLANAVPGTMPGFGPGSDFKFPSIGSVSVRRLATGALEIDGIAFTGLALLIELGSGLERREVEEALAQFGLDRTQAADVLAARAYVWTLWMAPISFPNLPYGDKRTAEVVMRYEQQHPGTAGQATRGNQAAIAAIASLISESTAGVLDNPDALITERTSTFRALSTYSKRARALVANTPLPSWQVHHLLPFMVVDRLPTPVRAAIVASGWMMDSAENVMALPSNLAAYHGPPNLTALPQHSTAHSNYDAVVASLLAPIASTAVGMPPADLRKALLGVETTMEGQLFGRRRHPRVY